MVELEEMKGKRIGDDAEQKEKLRAMHRGSSSDGGEKSDDRALAPALPLAENLNHNTDAQNVLAFPQFKSVNNDQFLIPIHYYLCFYHS